MPGATAPQLKRSFPPVADERTRLLILGSLPGEESLARARYYANPRNQFWRLTGAVIGKDLEPLDYEERLAALLAAGVGLWDVVAAASRSGSLDTAIRGHSANDLKALAARLPALKAVAFNGGTSARIGLKQLAGLPLRLVPLPSSSPALTLAFEDKLRRWMEVRPFVSVA
jgi:hypoxanthine-DNA glycosylase